MAKGDSVLYQRGFGGAEMAWRVPNAPDAKEWTIMVLDNTNGDVGRIGIDLVRLLLGQSVAAPK